MALAAGTRLGPYEIQSPIGAGGMGEVYKAKDTRLDRIVAIKILPASMSGNPEFRQRFEREARAISKLSHPHICSLYDVGSEGDVEYLVMEFLEGETLADRMTKGLIPFEQVLKFGMQIADALDRAHRQGIVHRDLKPGNVMLTPTGVKLLDFGLAKHLAPQVETELSQLSSLPTRLPNDRPLTEAGTIMGTFQYMSPEQLEGQEADARTDIFAFGAILYEMATGQKAFAGKSRASMIAAILERDPPPISSIAPMTPPAFERLVKTCLAKEPEDRFQTAHDIKLQLQWVAEGGSQAGVPAPVAARRRSRERVWIAAAVILGLVAAGLASVIALNRPAPPLVVQSSLLPPEKGFFEPVGGPPALSPDGTRLAMVVTAADGTRQIWIRPLSGLTAQPLQGTTAGSYPFWSPDSRYIGFFIEGKLRKIDAAGGPAESICDAPNGRGGSWGKDGIIVFAPNVVGALSKVSAAGGAPETLASAEEMKGAASQRFPCFLPDGRHYLFLYRGPNPTGAENDASNTIQIGSIDEKKVVPLMKADTQAQYAAPGYIVYWKENILLAQPFSARSLKLAGDAFPIAEGVQHFSDVNSAYFSVAGSGLLCYQSGNAGGRQQLVWYDRTGREIEKVGAPGNLARPRLSHDMQRVAVDVIDPASGNTDIWIYEFGRKTMTRFTFDPANDSWPVWSQDDRSIIFASARKGLPELFRKSSGGGGEDEPFLSNGKVLNPMNMSGDGRTLVMTVRDPKAGAASNLEVWGVSLLDKKATPFLTPKFNAGEPVISPDGRYVAYVSSESGRNEIYVQSFPAGGGKWQISSEGGEDPLWSRDGKELFFVANGNRLTTVPIKSGEGFQAGNPQFLFEARFKGTIGQQYDVSADGSKFLISADVATQVAAPITLVQNWLAAKSR